MYIKMLVDNRACVGVDFLLKMTHEIRPRNKHTLCGTHCVVLYLRSAECGINYVNVTSTVKTRMATAPLLKLGLSSK